MKKILALLLLLLYLAPVLGHEKDWAEKELTSNTTLGGWNAKSSLVAHFECDDNLGTVVVLESKPAFAGNGTLQGGNNTEDLSVAGLVTQESVYTALDFGGVVDAVEIDAVMTAAASDSAGSIFVVIEPDAIADNSTAFISFNDTSAAQYVVWRQATDDGKVEALLVDAGVVQWHIRSEAILVNGTASWLALVQDASVPVMYHNGELLATTQVVSTDLTKWFSSLANLDNARISSTNHSGAGNADWFDGTIDDVRIYNTALSVTDILGIYNQGVGTQQEAGTIPLTAANALDFYFDALTEKTDPDPTDLVIIQDSATLGAEVGHYKQNDDAPNTIIANEVGNDATLEGGDFTQDINQAGKINGSLLYNGTDDCGNLDNIVATLSATTQGSWIFWIKPSDIAANNKRFIAISATAAPSEAIEISQNPTAGKIDAACFVAGVVQWKFTTDAVVIANGVWAQVELSHNGTLASCFINGSSTAITYTTTLDQTAWISALTNADNMTIACIKAGGVISSFFTGEMDDVRIVNRVLTSGERATLYAAGSGTESDLEAATGEKKSAQVGNLLDAMSEQAGATFDWNNQSLIDIASAGIGTETLDGILHIDNGASDTDVVIEKDDATDAGIIFHNAGVAAANLVFNSSENIVIENDTVDQDIILKVNDGAVDTEVMRIDGSTSRVGILVADPQVALEVGDLNETFSGIVGANSEAVAVGGDNAGRVYIEGANQADLILDDSGAAIADRKLFNLINSDGTTRVRLLNDAGTVKVDNALAVSMNTGFVGFGTGTPDGIGHFDAGVADTDLIIEKDAGTSADIIFHNAGAAAAHIAFDSNEDILFENDTTNKDIIFKVLDGAVDTEIMRFDGSTSRVGILSPTPEGTLDIKVGSAGAVTAQSNVDDLILESNANVGISLLTEDARQSGFAFGSPSNNAGAFMTWNFSTGAFNISTSEAGAKINLKGGAGVTGLTIDSNSDTIIANGHGAIVGHTVGITAQGPQIAEFQILGTGGEDTKATMARFSNNASGPTFSLVKSRSGTIGTPVIAQDGDQLGAYMFLGDDGTDFATVGAAIEAYINGAPAVNSLPTELRFSTTLTTGPVLALTLDKNQDATFVGDIIGNAGILSLQETVTPAPTVNFAKIYSKNTNTLHFQDGAGVEHLVHGDAFSGLWFHSATNDTVEIADADTFTLVDSFENVGEEDDLTNVVGNATTDTLTVGVNGGGNYTATFHTSITSVGAASEMVIAVGITLNSALTISAATNATPIVCTSTAHGLLNGDLVTISGATGNTAANGDWFVTAKTADTFTLVDLQGANSVGNGVYDVDTGSVTIKYPGNLAMNRVVSQTDLGTGGAHAIVSLVAGDVAKLYVANVNATRDLEVVLVNMTIQRTGD